MNQFSLSNQNYTKQQHLRDFLELAKQRMLSRIPTNITNATNNTLNKVNNTVNTAINNTIKNITTTVNNGINKINKKSYPSLEYIYYLKKTLFYN